MSDKVVVHLPTQESRETYMAWLEKRMVKSLPLYRWRAAKKESYVEVITGSRVVLNPISYVLNEGYRIISLEEAMKEEQKTLADFGERFESIKQFEPAPEFVRGEEVEVSDDNEEWEKRIYITTIEGARMPYISVRYGSEAYFLAGLGYDVDDRTYIRKIPQVQEGVKKFTREYICEFTDKSLNDGRRLLIEFCEKHGMLKE